MATYKVLQDVEAEDKLVGPLTLRQFIYAGIAAINLYLGFLVTTKHAAFMLAIFVPIAFVTGFFAFPWGQDQPTEVWALAKIRFYLKPRKRIWDQSGAKELVTVTAPKKIERALTNGLNQEEVRSRLNALANTIDSRGWAIKNVNVNLDATMPIASSYASDRLVQASSLPQEVSNVDIRASDDMLDANANPIAQHFDSMISASTAAHHQQILARMQQPSVAAPAAVPQAVAAPPVQSQPQQRQQAATDYWFMHPTTTVPGQATFIDTPVIVPGAQAQPTLVPQAAMPTAEEEALVARIKAADTTKSVAYGHMKTLKTPEQLLADQAAQQAAAATAAAVAATKPQVTPVTQAVIMDLSNNDDLDVATIARQANKAQLDDGEVVISLR